MSYQIIVKPEAEDDAEKAALWYEEQRPGLGEEFLECLESKLSSIESNPQLFELKYQEIRQAYLSRFPYTIHYLVENKTIYIIAILYSSINPDRWKERK